MLIARKRPGVWRNVKDVGLDHRRDQFVVFPHHPDRLRRPPPRPGAFHADVLQRAFTWNVFRTLELLPPAFWLRRLQARLHNLPTGEAAPQIVRVELWRELPQPPARRLIDPDHGRDVADVLIETEHAVWTLMVVGDEMTPLEGEAAAGDPIARLIDAGSWFAGTRDYYFGLLVLNPERAPLATALVQRYGRSQNSLTLRSGSRGETLRNVRGVGLTGWTDLAAILEDCQDNLGLADIERALARNALTWLGRVGIEPATEP